MTKREFGAVAVDLGASSGRFAAGWIEDGQIRFEVIEQKPHGPSERNGRLEWDLEFLLGLCRSAAEYATANFKTSTMGIDAWGVDHGFLDLDGNVIGNPVCYRDLSHAEAFDDLAPYRAELYRLTGIQHQPFNTICQLAARRKENPLLPGTTRFLILPDLLGYLLTGEENYELTEASTTQLMGLDGNWCPRAFELAGWPVPERQPAKPGTLGAEVSPGVRLGHVGSHDTASALLGFGLQRPEQMYVNVGTWSLAMLIRDVPIATPTAEAANFTNERMVDGRVRFLKNIPGFYVVNRLHDELKIAQDVPTWLAHSIHSEETVDLFAEEFFNPDSMVEACIDELGFEPETNADWAGVALASLASAIAFQPLDAVEVGAQKPESIRIGGGGSQSAELCQKIADLSGLRVDAGPVEATVLGNLGLQFLAAGHFDSMESMQSAVAGSAITREFFPR
ncbi:MAG: hypothetical protein IT203_09875 [Fimbriimonadaceae bacterium]|nr:hypothetical protein [Fimbriimonadaceae bacterium]